MDNTKHLSLGFSNKKFEIIKKVNDEFSLVKIYVAGIGKNRNKSYISEETINAALGSLSYCPIVAHLYEKKDEETGETKLVIGGHDAELVIDENGIRLKDLTVPFGVVIADSFDKEVVTEYGEDVTYITAQAYLWTGRYPDLMDTIYSEDVWFNQSMEIQVNQWRQYKEDSNFVEILDMTFSALCLLYKSDNKLEQVEPCFISSRVEPVKFSFDDDFTIAFGEMKDKLAFCLGSTKFQEGGEKTLTKEMIEAILLEYKLTLESLNFEIGADMTEEVFRNKIAELSAEAQILTPAEQFSATYNQKRDALENALDPVIERDEDGNVTKHVYCWVVDFDDTHVFVRQNTWVLDDYSSKHGRFSYTFDETTKTATLTSDFTEMIITWLTLEENAALETAREAAKNVQIEFETYKNNYSVPNSEVEELKTFKTETLKAQRSEDEIKLFEAFNDKLTGDADFEALKTTCGELSLEEIENKCFAILGKKLAQFSVNTKKSTPVRVPVVTGNDDTQKPYGGVHEKYLK